MTDHDPQQVTTAELVSNIRYGYWFNLLCERLYHRIDVALSFIQLIGGSAVAVTALQSAPAVAGPAGLLVAAAATVSLLMQPAVKAERHLRAKCGYLDLEARAWTMGAESLVRELTELRKAAPAGWAALAVPAFNATINAIGVGATRSETAVQRLARMLA